jgi:DNA anti-recombination protein RmuC
MDSSIWVAVISGLFVAIPSIIATVSTINRNNAVTDERLKVINDNMVKLNDKVDVFGTDIPQIKVRLDHLEKDVDDLKRRQ